MREALRKENSDFSCRYRGAELRRVRCQVCGSRGKQVAVFGCSLHGECTLSRYKTAKQAEHCCNICADWNPSVMDDLTLLDSATSGGLVPIEKIPKFTTREWRNLPQEQKDFWRQQKRMRRESGVGEFAPKQPADGETPFMDFDRRPIHLSHFGRGAACFIVLGGPSLKTLDLARLQQRGVFTLAVNNAATVIRPNAFAYVDPPLKFVDAIWLDPAVLKFVPDRHFGRGLRTRGANGRLQTLEFGGRQVLVRDVPGVIGMRRNACFDPDRYLPEASINWGNDKKHARKNGQPHVLNSMFCCLKLAYSLGFRVVYLLGCDFNMTAAQPYAFDAGKHDAGVDSNNGCYVKMQRMFADLRPRFDAAGYRVFNCNPHSHLTAFDHVPFDEAVRLTTAHIPQDPINTADWYTK